MSLPLLRSHHSLLFGLASPRALVEEAAALGHTALALADRDAVAGHVEFLEACAERGVRAILGAEITGMSSSLLLLAENDAGFGIVCRVVTARHLDGDFDVVAALSDGAPDTFVIASTPSLAARLRERIASGRLFLALPPPRPGAAPSPGAVPARELAASSRALGVPLFACAPVTFLASCDVSAHRTLRAAALGVLEADLAPSDLAPPSERLLAPAALASLFHDTPDAVAALLSSARVVAACNSSPPSGRPIFPSAPLPAGAVPLDHLRDSCLEGLRRLAADTPAARALLSRELDVIAKLGFVDYFVIVGDIVRAARARGIPTVGRGSGASALVAYALGITNVNPLHYDLVFERFLHEKRADCPDLDIDLCWRGRDDVIEHVYNTYGRDRVAMISTHVLFHPRSAFREAARGAGLPPKRIDALSKLLPSTWETAPFGKPASHAPPSTAAAFRERLQRDPHARRTFASDPRLAPVLERAASLLGIPRHFGIHSGGIVIGDRPLTAYTALTRASKGLVVTQHEMRAIEKIGLVKIDLLGNRALSVLRDTADFVGRRAGGFALDLDALPEASEPAARLLAEGDALGVFQVESPGMRNLLRQIRPSDTDGVIDALSLIRPGPAASGMKDLFVMRARGLEPALPREPRLDRLLAGNHGILLYEEDVMRVVALVADVPLSDADGVRRAIGRATTPEDWKALERWFVSRALANGYVPDVARSVWADLARFGAYAFCKAHASGYGVLAYRMAHLKALYPAEFAVAFLNNGAGMYPPRVHVEDARRRGVGIRGPCVLRSAREFTLEEGAAAPGAFCVGLGTIVGLSAGAIESIVEARAVKPFASIEDLLRRARLSRPEAETLVLCGACDAFGENRPRLLWRVLAGAESERAHRGSDPAAALFAMETHRTARPAPLLADHSEAMKREHERMLLGFPIASHPLAPRAADLARAGIVSAADLLAAPARYAGRRASVCGLASARRRVDTKSGDVMYFLTLEDATGLVECTIFPGAARRLAPVARRGGALVARGRVEDHLGAVTLTVDDLRPLEEERTPVHHSWGIVSDAVGSVEATFASGSAPPIDGPQVPWSTRRMNGPEPSRSPTGSIVTNAPAGARTTRSPAKGKSDPGNG